MPTVYTVAVTDAIATINGQGEQWAIALVNHHPSETVACRRKPGNMPLQGTFSAKVLAGDSPDAFNDIEHPDRVAPEEVDPSFRKGSADLPPHSLTILHLVLK